MNNQLCQHGFQHPWVPPGTVKKPGPKYGQQYPGFWGKAEDGCVYHGATEHRPTVAVEGSVPDRMGGAGAEGPRDILQGRPTDWAAKDRLICAQTAVKAACNYYQGGAGGPDAVMELAARFYSAFVSVQAGAGFPMVKHEETPF